MSWIQNEFMRSSFLPKYKPKITRISALPNKQGSLPTLTKKSPTKVLRYYDCLVILMIFGLHCEFSWPLIVDELKKVNATSYRLWSNCFRALSSAKVAARKWKQERMQANQHDLTWKSPQFSNTSQSLQASTDAAQCNTLGQSK